MSRRAATLVAVAAAWGAPAVTAHLRFGSLFGIRYDSGRDGYVALTFDDGPEPGSTNQVVAALDRLNVRATFFVLGSHAKRYPEIITELVACGHVIESHGYDHIDHALRSPRAIQDDMRRAHAQIADLTGRAPRLVRPPHGVVTWPTLHAARTLDQQVCLWTRWGRDWTRSSTADDIARRVTKHLRAHDTVLLHDGTTYGHGDAGRTAAALHAIVDRASQLNLSCGPVIS